MQPIIKWAGGKRRIIKKLKEHIPQTFNRYFEPFLGGGALLFDMTPSDAYVSDINAQLIELYCVIRDEPDAVLEQCYQWKNDRETYYSIRELDRNVNAFGSLSSCFRAARFMYLNKTCFNGLYRVGPNGFNTPWGKGDSVALDKENIKNVSAYLKKIRIECHGFETLPSLVKSDDFVYLDPPYAPINPNDEWFSGYGVEFGIEQQRQLRNVCLELRDIGSHGLLSNSDVPIIHELYDGFNVMCITAPRSISSNGDDRKSVGEVLVKW